MEGNEKGLIEMVPNPYNVVLDDETYKGEIKIGLKFIPNVSIPIPQGSKTLVRFSFIIQCIDPTKDDIGFYFLKKYIPCT